MVDQADFYNRALGESYKVPPTERELILARLAQKYDAVCEAFDRTVCTGPLRDGRIMPAGGQEASLIERNSRAVRARILLENPGVTRQDLHKAIRRHHAESRA